ncbi:MAG: sugar nucleotide-binding protein [Deltaproteobacteria bacterium]|nr:sugar nucleotide-binding protein [Deltaproteobacteria bacterium]
MKILVTGAAALVGGYFTARAAREYDVVALKRSDLDITDRDAVHRCVRAERPGLIVNCAVIQVDESQENPTKAHAVNVEGPRFLARAANELGAEIIHFSTQYAFDGEPLDRPFYTINDQPNPVNNYGKFKVTGEAAVREACARSYIIRTSWVYGRGKNSFLCTVRDDLRSGKRVRAIDDIWSSTTYAADLVDRVLAIRSKQTYGTFHVVNEGVCTYYEYALEAGKLAGLSRAQIDALIDVTHERDMQRVAVRPRYTPMRCILSEQIGLPPMRDWQAALLEYVRA